MGDSHSGARFRPSCFILGTVANLVIVFPLAYAWHLELFHETYGRLGYIARAEPILAFGFAAVLLQGGLLSFLYPWLSSGSDRWVRDGLRFALLTGGYHWTVHVLAAAAKQSLEPVGTWFFIETVYLAIQFACVGLAIAAIYQRGRRHG